MAVSSTTNGTGNVGLSLALANQAQAQAQVAANASSSSSSTGDRTVLNANFDTFLTLLTTQLKNQNPLDPLNTDQFTQQITQFSSVEQQVKTNSLLSQLINNQNTGSLTAALNFLGNSVVANGDTAELKNGTASFTVNSPVAVNATITVTNAGGKVVRTEQRSFQSGTSTYQFNGRNDAGVPQPDGNYKISIAAKSSDGSTQTVSTKTNGTVTAVDLSSGEPILTVNGNKVKLSDVVSVTAKGG